MWVLPLGWEDPLEEGIATHSSILARKNLMDRGAWRATVHDVAKSQTWLSVNNIYINKMEETTYSCSIWRGNC